MELLFTSDVQVSVKFFFPGYFEHCSRGWLQVLRGGTGLSWAVTSLVRHRVEMGRAAASGKLLRACGQEGCAGVKEMGTAVPAMRRSVFMGQLTALLCVHVSHSAISRMARYELETEYKQSLLLVKQLRRKRLGGEILWLAGKHVMPSFSTPELSERVIGLIWQGSSHFGQGQI